MAFSDWETTAANNATKPGINWAEGMAPDAINNSARQMMADMAALKGTGGALTLGIDDAAAGAKFTTIQGFFNYLISTVGSSIVGFVQSGVGAVFRSVQNKLRDQCSIKDYGAVCDFGTTDDSLAFIRAINAGFKRIYVPDGATITSDIVNLSGLNGVKLVGDGVQASRIYVLGTTGTAIGFYNCQDCGVVDIGFVYVNEPTAGQVLIFYGCFEPVARVRMDYHYNGIWVQSGSEPNLQVVARYGFGPFIGVFFGGLSGGSGVYGATLRYHGDNPSPVAITGYKAYAALTAFTVGQVTLTNGRVFVATQGGTTGAASSPNATSGSRFATDINDGTVKWRFLCRSDGTHITQTSGAYSIRVKESFALNAAYSYRMTDILGTSYPMWGYLGLESDHAVVAGISLEAGEGVYINDNAWVGSCLSGNGIQTISAFRGELHIANTVRVLGNAQHGLFVSVGSVYDIQGLYSGNSQLSAGTYHGMSFSAGVTDFTVRAICGRAKSVGATQGYGVFINATADRFIIDGCNLTGNVTGGSTGPAASATKVYGNNL